MYVSCYGNPIGIIICFNLETLKEIFYFKVHRPRGLIILDYLLYITEVNYNRIGIYNLHGIFKGSIGNNLLKYPRGITTDKKNLIIADSGNHRIVILSKSRHLLKIINNLNSPNDVYYSNNKLFISVWYNKKIKLFDFYKNNIIKTYNVPIESGYLAMLTLIKNNLYVYDNSGFIHVFNYIL